VKEESQIEDMRAALRGDRERAEQARQRSTENVLPLVQSHEREPEPPAHERPRLLGRLLGR
jgi:hypothetical protein